MKSIKSIAKASICKTFPVTERLLAVLFARKAEKISINKPIFVIGPDRSGTSMVYAMLANHPDVFALTGAANNFPDYPFSASLIRRILLSRKDNYYAIPNAISSITGGKLSPSEAINYWQRHLGSRNGGWMHASDDFFTEEDLDDATRHTLPQDLKRRLFILQKKRFVLKQPGFSLKIRYLDALFPDAIFVHCLRNPWDNFLSLIKQKQELGADWGVQIPASRMRKGLSSLHGRTAEQLAVTYEMILEDIAKIKNGFQRYVPAHYEAFQNDFMQETQKLFRGCDLQAPRRILENPDMYVRPNPARTSRSGVTNDAQALEMLEKLCVQMGYASTDAGAATPTTA